MTSHLPIRPSIRPSIAAIETQQIMQVSELALDDPNVIPLWYGESDMATPAFICDAASAALAKGETFYTHKRGIPELRTALGRYIEKIYASEFEIHKLLSGNPLSLLSAHKTF